jgi:hypothetical protein
MRVNSICRKIQNRLWQHYKGNYYEQRVRDSPLVQNINFDCDRRQKKALICYLPNYYFQNIDPNQTGRTIAFEIFKVVKVLSEFGFCIDIISVNDIKAINLLQAKHYDLIFGFGESFYRITKLQPKAVSVLYMTENHPDFSEAEERKRIDYYYKRHRIQVPLERSGLFYKKEHLSTRYNFVIALGEVELLQAQYEKPFSIFPTGILNPEYGQKGKDHESARKHFLWLGSSAVIHKGLDLLLDIFSLRDDVTLHICGLNKESRRKLHILKRANIIDYGHVNINSKQFLDIVYSCSFSILPSCSEGMATSITTSMLHGLIPVVLRNTGFNRLGDCALFMDDFKIEYLNLKISEFANLQASELDLLSKRAQNFASSNFGLETYEKNMRAIFNEITEKTDERRL